MIKNKRLFQVLCMGMLCFYSCKKSEIPAVPTIAENEGDMLKLDSLFLYAKQVYLWNEQLPAFSAFQPRSYAVENSLDKSMGNELLAISRYAINHETQKSFEYHEGLPGIPKYSTITSKDLPETSGNLNDHLFSNSGFGLAFSAVAEGDLRIEYVIPNSPAAIAGLKRGMQISKINSAAVETNERYYQILRTSLSDSQIAIAIAGGGDIPDKLFKLRRSMYQASPIAKDTVISINQHKIGYISYLQFNSPNGKNTELDKVFDHFAKENIDELVVDLRYNNGGYISTCDYFANLLIPQNSNGAVMRKEKYNKLMQGNENNILKNQIPVDDDGRPVYYIDGRPATLADGDYSLKTNTYYFEKKSGLKSLKRICFIISPTSASASELLINCLRPYMEVKITGVSANKNTVVRSYGKPVGFFPVKIGKYQVYYSMFQNLNARDEGDYYDGFAAQLSVQDNASFDFADLNEPGLRASLSILGFGITPAPLARINKLSSQPKKESANFSNVQIRELSALSFPIIKKKAGQIKFKRPV